MMDPDRSSQELHYSISEKNSILIISFSGAILKTNGDILEKCQNEISEKQVKCIILNLQGVHDISGSGVPGLVKLQAFIRKKQAVLRLCSLSPPLGQLLMNQGALRAEEVFETLAQAIESCRHFISP